MKYLFWSACVAGVLLLVLSDRPKQLASAEPKQAAPRKEPELKVQIEELRSEIKKLQQLVPDQAAIMTHVGYHWSNLWFALEQENWPLADFYLSETRNNVKWAVRAKPIRKTGPYTINLVQIAEGMDNSQFTQMKMAIDKKDKQTCIKLYDQSLSVCYACHKASDKPFLRPQRPSASEARMINFDPKAKEPQ